VSDEDTSSRTAEIATGPVAFERLHVQGDALDVLEKPLAEVSFGQVPVEVAAVLQRRRFVALAKSALDSASGFLLWRDVVSSIANCNVRRVVASTRQEVLQIVIGHPVEVAEMSQQRRSVDADEATLGARERRHDGKVGRQRVVEVLREVIAPTFRRKRQRAKRTLESRRWSKRRCRRIQPTFDGSHRSVGTCVGGGCNSSVGDVFRRLFGEFDDDFVGDAVVKQQHGLVGSDVVALRAAERRKFRQFRSGKQ